VRLRRRGRARRQDVLDAPVASRHRSGYLDVQCSHDAADGDLGPARADEPTHDRAAPDHDSRHETAHDQAGAADQPAHQSTHDAR
jgi:hypothetical protein